MHGDESTQFYIEGSDDFDHGFVNRELYATNEHYRAGFNRSALVLEEYLELSKINS